ncbi:MAG: septation protein IspZ, partial [Rhodobacteraceae bacterium]|nr:septation protein IspZ [Paracoccaceae bacterium]
MAGHNSKPGLKMILEIGPLILFFVGYFLFRDKSIVVGSTEYDGFIMITALFVPVLIVSTVLLWKLTGELSRMQIMTVLLVIVFGGLTVFLNDERFIKMKPTIIYLLFTVTLGFGLLQKKSYLQSLMGQALPLTDRGWMVLTQRTTLFFLFLAIANEIIWRF